MTTLFTECFDKHINTSQKQNRNKLEMEDEQCAPVQQRTIRGRRQQAEANGEEKRTTAGIDDPGVRLTSTAYMWLTRPVSPWFTHI